MPVLLGRQLPALLEEHLGPPVAEIGEHDRDQLVDVVAGLVGRREDEALGEQAGWSFEVERGEEGDRFKLEETLSAETLLLGRVTYEGFAAAWPSREGEFADKFNTMPKYVVSSEHDLVDELRLMVFPVVLGSGKRLFDRTSDKKPFRLVDSKTVGDGVAILVYAPTGGR